VQPNDVVNPTPGSIVVHVNGRILFGAVDECLDVFRATPTVAAQKVAPISTTGYMRFFTGVDAMAANGLRYGGSIGQNALVPHFGGSHRSQLIVEQPAERHGAGNSVSLGLGFGNGL
jgi:hypothetical protein